MINPVRVYVGFEAIVGSNGENQIDDSLSANKRVTQTVEVIDDRAREGRLRSLLDKYGKKSSKKEPIQDSRFCSLQKGGSSFGDEFEKTGMGRYVNSWR